MENDDLKSMLGVNEEEESDFIGYKESFNERLMGSALSKRGSTLLNKE